MHAAIEKASYCKIAFLPVLLTCSSPMHCVAGKGPPQMLVFGKMQKVSAFQRDVFLLADTGFPHCERLLVPYQGGQYHLSESRSQHQRLFLFID